MERIYKISTIGDIMCEPPLLAQVTSGGNYDFDPVFAPMKSLFDEADYVIGNLETPLAGEAAGYTSSLVSFNTPDNLATTLKNLGVDAVSTANNHCCDRGQAGLERTLKVLDSIGLAHTGTYANPNEKNRILYFQLGSTRLALIAYTYSYNKVKAPSPVPPDELEHCVNRLMPLYGNMTSIPPSPLLTELMDFILKSTGHEITWEEKVELKKMLGIPVAHADIFNEWEKYEKYLRLLQEDIAEAKQNADLVLFLPHVGGQFNIEPGTFSEEIVKKSVSFGADAVLAAHSHTTQKAEVVNGVPCFYSLGNVTMWPNSIYSVRESLPEYGLAAHTYVQNGKIVKNSFSIFKICQSDSTPLSVIPCDELYNKLADEKEKEALLQEVAAIYTRVTGKQQNGKILREYAL